LDKFEGFHYTIEKAGTRVLLDNAVVYLEVGVDKEVDVNSHTLFIGKVVESEMINDGEPMTYAFYHEVRRGTTPRSAPTYSKLEEVRKIVKYRCKVCGYIYDSEKGDPDSGVKPSTSFEDIPDSWVCPICGVSKDQFERIE